MTKTQIAEKVVKDFTAATNNNSSVLPTPFSSVLGAPVSFNPYDLKEKIIGRSSTFAITLAIVGRLVLLTSILRRSPTNWLQFFLPRAMTK